MSDLRRTTCSAVALSLGLVWYMGCASFTLRSGFTLGILPESIEIPVYVARFMWL